MRRLLWLGVVIGAFLLSSCGSSENKTSPKDVIGDEEYRVMSAVLKEFATRPAQREDVPPMYLLRGASDSSRDDSVVLGGTIAYNSLRPRYGQMARLIWRDTIRGKVAYDSLHRQYGDLSYYVTVHQNTLKTTRADSPEFKDKKAASRLSLELIQSFDTNNLINYKLDRERFIDSLVVELISREDVDSTLWGRYWWSAFYERFPLANGIMRISRVGFNSDTTVAVVRVKAQSGPVSGAEWFSLLEKKVDRWIVVAEQVYLVN